MLYALVFGSVLPMVIRMNEVLGRHVGQLPASVSVHLTGAIFGLVCMLPFAGAGWTAGLGRAPWWSFLGGVFGAGLVVLANQAVGRMGVASFTAVNIGTQLIASGLMDHYGLLGSPVHPMSATRVLGAVLLAAGGVLVVRG